MDEAEADVLADMSFPPQRRAKLHSTHPLERPIGEIKRRTDVHGSGFAHLRTGSGIVPNEGAITRLVGAILMEHNNERGVRRARSTTLETITPLSDDPRVSLSAPAG